MLEGADLNCDSAVEIADFKMYLSAIALRDAGGRWIDIALAQTGPWQNAEVALLSVDSCQALNGNLAVTGTWPGSQARGLRFELFPLQ